MTRLYIENRIAKLSANSVTNIRLLNKWKRILRKYDKEHSNDSTAV